MVKIHNSYKYSFVWMATFIYCLSVGLIIQLVILPHFLPSLHGGNGLLAARDWLGFHEMALTQANDIIDMGWNAFKLRPDGDNPIAGVLSIFYVFFPKSPWVLLPLNAALYALAATALYSIIKNIGLSNKDALICILPFVFFPSASIEYAQIHKDVFCTAGFLVSIASSVKLLNSENSTKVLNLILFTTNVISLAAIWIFRPYYLIFFILFYSLLVVVCTFIFLRCHYSKLIKGAKNLLTLEVFTSFTKIFYLLLLALLAYFFSNNYLDIYINNNNPNLGVDRGGVYENQFQPSLKFKLSSLNIYISDTRSVRDASRTFAVNKLGVLVDKSTSPDYEINKSGAYVEKSATVTPETKQLASSNLEIKKNVINAPDDTSANISPGTANQSFISRAAERVFVKISVARNGFVTTGVGTAATNIDQEIVFQSLGEAIKYIPRAFQVGLFSPFPSLWYNYKDRNSSFFEVFLSSTEMAIVYICFLGWLYWLYSIKNLSTNFLIPSLFCLTILLILGMSVANVGTIYRMRFPFEMTIVSLGIAGWLKTFSSIRKH